MTNDILKALNWRYATKVFDATKKIPAEDLNIILESGRLAPSSFGLEPWKFLVIENPELRGKLRAVSYGQSGVTDASHVVVITTRTDMREKGVADLIERMAKSGSKPAEEFATYQGMIEGSMKGQSDEEINTWMANQVYIALGMMMETAALLGVDACPMEGFESEKVDELLGLKAKNLTSTVMIALGYRGDDKYAAGVKVRMTSEEAIEWVK